MQGNLVKIVLLALVLMAVPVAALLITDATSSLAQSRPARNTQRLMEKVEAAKVSAQQNADGQLDLERYLGGLKEIDSSRTPGTAQRAFSNFVASVELCVAAAKEKQTNEVWMREESALKETARRIINKQRGTRGR